VWKQKGRRYNSPTERKRKRRDEIKERSKGKKEKENTSIKDFSFFYTGKPAGCTD